MELAEHANTVMETLDESIKSLDDMDAFLTYLHQVGASHTKIPGFNKQYFWVTIHINKYIIRCLILFKSLSRLRTVRIVFDSHRIILLKLFD